MRTCRQYRTTPELNLCADILNSDILGETFAYLNAADGYRGQLRSTRLSQPNYQRSNRTRVMRLAARHTTNRCSTEINA
jgi:hypothetical protein